MRRALSALFLLTGHALAAEAGDLPPAPAKAAPKPASAAAKPAAPPAPTPAVPAPAAAPAAPSPAPAPKAGDSPPPEYYVEPGYAAPAPGSAPPPANAAPSAPPSDGPPPPPPGAPPPPPSGPPIYEPPPPGFFPGDPVYEPPPPPEPHHLAPLTSLWLGVRLGWFMPFGSAFARGVPVDNAGNVNLKGVGWRDYVSSGPMFELDAGARLSRNYNVFALWERAQLGGGSGDPGAGLGKSKDGDTDYWGIGIRATSDPDRVGFVTELAIGYRRARAKYDDGSEVQFTDAPFEARLGLGADIRINRVVTLSPMFTLGVGSFGTIDRKSNGTIIDHTGPYDQEDGHAWATLTMGGNFDVLSSQH